MKSKTLINILVGLGAAFLTILLHSFLSETKGLELSSFLLVLIGSVYYGFAVLSHDKAAVAFEATVASLFVMMGIAGLWVSPWILIAGLFLHGFWDIFHHNKISKNSALPLFDIPKWYIPFCAAYDWTMAIYLTFLYLK